MNEGACRAACIAYMLSAKTRQRAQVVGHITRPPPPMVPAHVHRLNIPIHRQPSNLPRVPPVGASSHAQKNLLFTTLCETNLDLPAAHPLLGRCGPVRVLLRFAFPIRSVCRDVNYGERRCDCATRSCYQRTQLSFRFSSRPFRALHR